MPNLDSGVHAFIVGTATVTVYFPVDEKGNAGIACKYCKYLASNNRTCKLNNEPVQYPERHVGAFCPLELEKEVNND